MARKKAKIVTRKPKPARPRKQARTAKQPTEWNKTAVIHQGCAPAELEFIEIT